MCDTLCLLGGFGFAVLEVQELGVEFFCSGDGGGWDVMPGGGAVRVCWHDGCLNDLLR